jgi:uncharacterized OB-fold protein
MRSGIVYTETVVHVAPPAFLSEAPYQVCIVSFDDGTRVTARVDGDLVRIGDPVVETRQENGVSFFRKVS